MYDPSVKNHKLANPRRTLSVSDDNRELEPGTLDEQVVSGDTFRS
jgi:hypothetical protein